MNYDCLRYSIPKIRFKEYNEKWLALRTIYDDQIYRLEKQNDRNNRTLEDWLRTNKQVEARRVRSFMRGTANTVRTPHYSTEKKRINISQTETQITPVPYNDDSGKNDRKMNKRKR